MMMNITGMSSRCHYGDYHDCRGRLITGDHYIVTVIAIDPNDPTFKRVGHFVYRNERSCAAATISASREGNAVVWMVA
jgi:hypothetical protein